MLTAGVHRLRVSGGIPGTLVLFGVLTACNLTGAIVDAATNLPIDAATNLPIDAATILPIDAATILPATTGALNQAPLRDRRHPNPARCGGSPVANVQRFGRSVGVILSGAPDPTVS